MPSPEGRDTSHTVRASFTSASWYAIVSRVPRVGVLGTLSSVALADPASPSSSAPWGVKHIYSDHHPP